MAKLVNARNNEVVASTVQEANSLRSRLVGLIGKKDLPKGEALWIKRCNSIHTFFMKFPIDVIFVDKDLKVKSIYKNLKPGKLTLPKLGATSVFELFGGSLNKESVNEGDQLHVVN